MIFLGSAKKTRKSKEEVKKELEISLTDGEKHGNEDLDKKANKVEKFDATEIIK